MSVFHWQCALFHLFLTEGLQLMYTVIIQNTINRSEERQDKGLCCASYVIQWGMARITSVHLLVTREHPLVKPNFKMAGKWPLPMLGGRGKCDNHLHSISVYQRWIKIWVISCCHDKDTRDFNDKTNIYEHLFNPNIMLPTLDDW